MWTAASAELTCFGPSFHDLCSWKKPETVLSIPIKFLVTHETWLSCRYYSYQRNADCQPCAESAFLLVCSGSPQQACAPGGSTSSSFPGGCEILSVLEEHNPWLSDRYLRYSLPRSNHRANEGRHHVVMKLVMVLKCSGLSNLSSDLSSGSVHLWQYSL